MAGFTKKRDGYVIIGKEDLKNVEFDYLIIAAKDSYKEILAEAIAMGISRKKIIDARVLQIPNFDLSRYASLRENPVLFYPMTAGADMSITCWIYLLHRRLSTYIGRAILFANLFKTRFFILRNRCVWCEKRTHEKM